MYQWLLALHIIAVIAWMAGLLYLPRLFVYHCEADVGSIQSETFKVMERRLLKAIMNPAMIVAWGLGLWLAYRGGWTGAHWFQTQVRPGSVHERRPRYPVEIRPRIRRDRPPQAAEILSNYQRDTNGSDDLIVILAVVKPF